ncbi:YDG/SRA domain-containing protein [Catenulispora pinisilvae]|uniref:YDG/SRA domain-containing protein n=1 Tax=Catenulispora pinisilvae TaxID=2705253 RepID=UPI0018921D72|nr:YDG/SRA domain-containing protein [Catenulispora pinisilvae]
MAVTFGEIGKYRAGATFADRKELMKAGLHTKNQDGISGDPDRGADAIVVSGGYTDDVDDFDVLVYTGHGGQDKSRTRQVTDQVIGGPKGRGNAAMVRSHREEIPVRVIRGPRTRKADTIRPETGYRYDGLYLIESYGSAPSVHGPLVWKFRMLKLTPVERSIAAMVAQKTPQRAPTTVNRILRDVELAQGIKQKYDHMCQVCGIQIEIDGGYYSEGAHIHALGSPYNGPDIAGNILSLCPNDHVRLDNGAIYLSDTFEVIRASDGAVLDQLRIKSGHTIDPDCVRKHRERFRR